MPRESISSIPLGAQQSEVLQYMKHSKTSEEVGEKPEGVLDDFWMSFVESWNSLFKVPYLVSKYHGRQDHQWRSGVFSKLYPFVIKDLDEQFEGDCRGVVPLSFTISPLSQDHYSSILLFPQLHQLQQQQQLQSLSGTTAATTDVQQQQQQQQQQQMTMHIPNMMTIGVQKTREIRQCLSKLKQLQKNPTIDQKLSLGESFVPFFCSKEMSDRGSQFQAENELALAMKSCLDCQYKCLGSQAKAKRRIVVGMTCVGAIVTGYIMRRKQLSQKAHENDDAIVSCMQPIDSFNLCLFDDLMRLAKFLASTKCYGDELVQDVRLRLKQLVSPKSGTGSSVGSHTPTNLQGATIGSPTTTTTTTGITNGAPATTNTNGTSPAKDVDRNTSGSKQAQSSSSKRKSPDSNNQRSSNSNQQQAQKKQKSNHNNSSSGRSDTSSHTSNQQQQEANDFNSSAGADSDLDADYDEPNGDVEQSQTQPDI